MLKALVTSGPTFEALDPVRYITNHSSGKQGYAIARELAKQNIDVTLVSGPVSIQAPDNINVIYVTTAEEMLQACLMSLPADIAIFTAAVCDWRPLTKNPHKIKKILGQEEISINFVKNPDILKIISNHHQRPKFVVGFAAESENLIDNAKIKLQQKNCDLIVANDITQDVFSSDYNTVSIVSQNNVDCWQRSSKQDIAEKLVRFIMGMDLSNHRYV
jgi:phosphopantothenoylcysteine decarboxylase/phosphopantothenate--cysteine ligase